MEWIAVGVLAWTFFVSAGMAFASFRSRETAVSRLYRVAGGDVVRGRRGVGSGASLLESVIAMIEPILPARDADPRKGTYGSIRQRLVEAGFRSRTALPLYMASRIVTSGVLALAAGPFAFELRSRLMGVGAFVAAVGIGYIAPGFVVDSIRSSRRTSLVRSLPDAIDLMVVCVEAGLSLGATIDRVAREFERASGAVAAELRLTVLETQAGKSLGDALRGLGARNGVQDLSTLTSALIQTERMGTRVADTLRVQADALRTRRLQRAEEVAQRAPVKMLIPAGVFIFPALLVVTLVPAFLGTTRLFG
jgi:tight adherence protein C